MVGRLADIEPDFDAFAARLTKWKARDPDAGSYGQWLNPLGRWDWRELGGRFDGAISGHPKPGPGNDSMISSGANPGRDLVGGLARALGGQAFRRRSRDRSQCRDRLGAAGAARRGEDRTFPTAIF
jgi:hypothetical protein